MQGLMLVLLSSGLLLRVGAEPLNQMAGRSSMPTTV